MDISYNRKVFMSYVGQNFKGIVMSFVIVFDIPRMEMTERRRIHRELVRGGAVGIQDSFWKSDRLKFLMDIGMRIRKIGGSATILEEKFYFNNKILLTVAGVP